LPKKHPRDGEIKLSSRGDIMGRENRPSMVYLSLGEPYFTNERKSPGEGKRSRRKKKEENLSVTVPGR